MADSFQEQVGAIWAKALGLKKIAPDDNFFALGGHSLLAVKVIAEIQAQTGIEAELKLSDFFDFPSLASFTSHLKMLTAPGEETGSL